MANYSNSSTTFQLGTTNYKTLQVCAGPHLSGTLLASRLRVLFIRHYSSSSTRYPMTIEAGYSIKYLPF